MHFFKIFILCLSSVLFSFQLAPAIASLSRDKTTIHRKLNLGVERRTVTGGLLLTPKLPSSWHPMAILASRRNAATHLDLGY